jgi:hypothetical protein
VRRKPRADAGGLGVGVALALLALTTLGVAGARREPTLALESARLVGGSAVDDCDAVDVDRRGAVYLGCHSDSADLPRGRSSGYVIKGDLDALVFKLAPDGTRVEYLAHVGGSGWEAVQDVAADRDGAAYAVGTTYSSNLPASQGAFQRGYAGGEGDAFVARLGPDGGVEWITYLGGSGLDDGRRVVVDADGNAIVVGRTASSDFPTTANALQPRPPGGSDAFVASFDASGRLLSSTYLGGAGDDVAWGVALDRAGNVHVAGQTASADFPLARPLQETLRGEGDCFLAILDASGRQLLFSSYWGGTAWDQANGLAVDRAGRIYLAGWVHSPDFPVTPGAFQRSYGGSHDAFVSAFDALGRGLRYSTYLGGERDDSAAQIAVDPLGRAFVVGGTESTRFPTRRALQAELRGTKDGFAAWLSADGSAALFSSYLGGGDRELFEDAAALRDGFVVSGLTASRDFPVAASATGFRGGSYDALWLSFRVRN